MTHFYPDSQGAFDAEERGDGLAEVGNGSHWHSPCGSQLKQVAMKEGRFGGETDYTHSQAALLQAPGHCICPHHELGPPSIILYRLRGSRLDACI